MLLALAVLILQIPAAPEARIESSARMAELATAAERPAPAEPTGANPARLDLKGVSLHRSYRSADDLRRMDEEAAAALPAPAAEASPLFGRREERLRTPKLWWALTFAGHGAAAFDAYSTRRAIQNGSGHEANPLLKPFAHSNALYFATQVQPAALNYVGLRMARSQKPWVRRIWWVPQVAGAAASLWAGAHNMRVSRHGTPGTIP